MTSQVARTGARATPGTAPGAAGISGPAPSLARPGRNARDAGLAGSTEPMRKPIRGVVPARDAAPAQDQKRSGPVLAPRLARVLFAARPSAPAIANHVGAGPIPAARTAADTRRELPAALQARLAAIVGARAVDAARIHTGPAAHARAIAHGARAVADGEDVFFADGEYRPGTRAGDALIAHELAHVDQAQRGVLHRPARKAMGGAEHSALEAAADKAGDQVTAGADIEKHKRPERDRKKPGAQATTEPAALAAGTPATGTPATAPADAVAATAEGEAGPQAPGAGKQKAPAVDLVPPELPRMPEPEAELSSKELGRVGAVKGRAGTNATATATAPAATENVAVAQAAVAVPQKESDARAAQQVVTKLAEREPPSPEIVALCERIKKLIADKRPADEDGVIDTRPQEVAQEAGGKVEGDVQKNVDDANASYGAINATPAGPAPAVPGEIQPLPEQVAAPPVNATAAKPDAVPPESVNLDADGAEMDKKAKDAGLEEETAQLVQSGPVADARDARGEMKTVAKDGPAEALKQQQAALTQADTDMAALQAQALASLKATRKGHVTSVKDQQGELKGGEEALRTKLAADAAAIYDDAQKRVQDLLSPVHDVAMKKWSTGLPLISKRFNDDLKVVKDKIEDRHSGVGGFFVSGWDAVAGLPGWVTKAYDAAEKNFGDDVCKLITDISADVNTVIKACNDIIAEARRQIAEIFTTNLPDGLKDWAAEQQKGFDKKLDQLHDKAEATRSKFNKELIDNAGGAVQAAREKIQKLRQEAKGLWGRFLDAVGKFLDDPLKFIIDGLLELVGISPKAFWALIDKIAQVISDIAWHPVRFISNLMDGVGAGFDLFFKNFAKHLKKGFFDWLFSGLKDLGVEVPPDFSLKSIITFFLQLMGISWARIRKMLADVIGEKYVAAAEKALKLVEIIAKGPQGIIDFIKDKLTPEAILERVLEMAIKYVVETLIKQVALYIIKLLNPVGAVLAAIETIYKVIKWIFHNAARIFHFIEAIVNALAAVVAGDISVVAAGVEKGLAMLIPPVIDFLAELLGLGDLPDQIAKIVKGLQAWVEGIIKSIIKFLADSAKSLLASLGIGGKDEKPGAGSTAVGETIPFTGGGESHSLSIEVQGTNASLMLHSEVTTVENWLKDRDKDLGLQKTPDMVKQKAPPLISEARQLAGLTDKNADKVAQEVAAQPKPEAAGSGPSPEQVAKDQKEVVSEERTLAGVLKQIADLFGLNPPIVVTTVVPHSTQKLQPPLPRKLVAELAEESNRSIFTAVTSDKTLIANLMEQDKTAFKDGTLTLPALDMASIRSSTDLSTLGTRIGRQSYVRRASIQTGASGFSVTAGYDVVVTDFLTGDHILTPVERQDKFASTSEWKPVDTKERFKPFADKTAKPYPMTSATPFRNSDYVGFFAATEKVDKDNATLDFSEWLARGEAGRLAKVNPEGGNRYVITQGSVWESVVEDTQASVEDPQLKEAVKTAGGIVGFMKKMAARATVGEITYEKFTELWKNSANSDWLKNQFRGADDGMHEWIPSNYIPDSIARASDPAKFVGGAAWIDLHHELRSDTALLVFKPGYWREEETEAGSEWIPQGHSGAVYVGDKPQTESQNLFHNALRTEFEDSKDIPSCIKRVRGVFEQWIWDGTGAFKRPLAPDLKAKGGVAITESTFAAYQSANFAKVAAKFDEIAGKFGGGA